MGGFHSLYISINNPKTFGYVGFFSAAIGKEQRSGGANEYIYDNLDKKLADLFAAKPKLFWIGIGNTDFLFKDNTAFERETGTKGYQYPSPIWKPMGDIFGEIGESISLNLSKKSSK